MSDRSLSPFWLNTLALVGVVVVIVGILSATSQLVQAVGGVPVVNSEALALGPALAVNPTYLEALTATTTPIVPARLAIPKIGVNASIESVGLNAAGSMKAPANFTDVAWYSLGSKPGEPGSTVIAGHVNNALTESGVFEHLSDLSIGDSIVVADASGKTLSFIVTQVEAYDADNAPLNSIFSTTGPSQLVLITCDGQWDPSTNSFDKRLIVTARLVD